VSTTHLKWIAGGLAVLLLLWGGSAVLSRGSDTVTGSLALPALVPADADTVLIVRGADSIVLAKQPPAAWTVNGRRAPPDDVGDLFRALQDSVHPELVAQDSASFARLSVDSAAGRWLRIRGGGRLRLQLIVGARGSEFQSAYVRRPGDSRVYLWRGRLAQLVDRRADDWRDKRIAALDPDSVSALDVSRGKDRYTMARAGKRWTVNGAGADSVAVARYLERLRAITAAGFATTGAIDSLKAGHATRRFTARGGAGRVLLALAFDSTAGGFLVRVAAGSGGEGATVYRMNSWDVDGVTPASRSLLPPKK
jgi:uncharacterized protein DUF4340